VIPIGHGVEIHYRPGRCPVCGGDLSGVLFQAVDQCPVCGNVVDAMRAYSLAAMSFMALLALAFVAALLLSPWFFVCFFLIGIVGTRRTEVFYTPFTKVFKPRQFVSTGHKIEAPISPGLTERLNERLVATGGKAVLPNGDTISGVSTDPRTHN